MKRKKLAWLVIAVTSVAVVVIAAYYFLARYQKQQAVNYYWKKDAEIVKVSYRFKSLDTDKYDRLLEGVLLFPVIKVGASTREMEELLGKPDSNYSPQMEPGIRIWSYYYKHGTGQGIHLKITDEGIVIEKDIT